MQVQPASQFFTDHLLFSNICEYLTIKELLDLSTLSQELKRIVEEYCKNRMRGLNMRPANSKSFIHQMQFYFNRCLRVARLDKALSDNAVTILHPFKFETIQYFEVGTRFCCYLTRDSKARIFRTSALINYHEQCNDLRKEKEKIKVQFPDFEVRTGVKEIKCKSEQCLIIKLSGEVSVIGTNRAEDFIVTSEEVVGWTARIPVETIYNSYAYSIFHPENPTDLATIFYQVFNKKYEIVKQGQETKCLYLVAKNMINSKEVVVEVPCEQIIEATVGNRHAYFISSRNQLFEADLEEKVDSTYSIVKARLFEPLKGRTIAKIASGYTFFVALERNLEQLEEWDTERVVQWLREIGFEAYIKIARVEKLDGKRLKNIEKKYMHNVLGITTQNMQQKFIMSIEQNLLRKSNKDQLWGWGKNENGQLGSSSANFVARPQKVRSPRLREGEYIDSIFCGWVQSYLRTQKGRIYSTRINCQKRKGSEYEKEEEKTEPEGKQKYQEKKVVDSENEYEEEMEEMEREGHRKKSSRGHNQKRKKKAPEPTHSIKREKETNRYSQEQNWLEFELGKAFFIQAYKEMLFVVQCPNQQKEEPSRIVKLRTAKAILDKILWSSINKEEFKVGYLDKDMGLIEATALDMQKFDVKENRIKYFKRNNIIVWDRDNKIDTF